MDPEDIAQFWEAKAAEWDPVNAPLVVWDELVLIADTTPQLLPEATSAAARAVGKRFCCHGDNEPQPLPDIRDLAARRTAAQQHPGLCGYHHSRWIGDVDFSKAAERSSGGQVTAKRLRNQASFDVSTRLNARGRGVQITRRDCFTQACRAVWPGDEAIPAAIAEALS